MCFVEIGCYINVCGFDEFGEIVEGNEMIVENDVVFYVLFFSELF